MEGYDASASAQQIENATRASNLDIGLEEHVLLFIASTLLPGTFASFISLLRQFDTHHDLQRQSYAETRLRNILYRIQKLWGMTEIAWDQLDEHTVFVNGCTYG